MTGWGFISERYWTVREMEPYVVVADISQNKLSTLLLLV